MKSGALIISLCAAIVFFVQCSEKKIEPAQVAGLDTYTDQSCGLSLKYPNNWIVSKE